jgi:hypothetical protein
MVKVYSNLTYLGDKIANVEVQNPIDWLSVLAPNMTVIWSYAVPGALAILNVTEGESFTSQQGIPNEVMALPGNYSIETTPLLNFGVNGSDLGNLLEVDLELISVPLSQGSISTSYSSQMNATTPENYMNSTATINSTSTHTGSVFIYLNSSAACQSLGGVDVNANASWNQSENECTVSGSPYVEPGFIVSADEQLIIVPNVTLVLSNVGGGYANYGEIDNNGTIEIESSFGQYGILNNFGNILVNSTFVNLNDTLFRPDGGTTNNFGYFDIQPDYYYNSSGGGQIMTGGNFGNGAILNNYGTVNSSGVFDNFESGNVNFSSEVNNYGTFYNQAMFESMYPFNVVNNVGTIINSASFVNEGTFYAYCGSTFDDVAAGTVSGNPFVSSSCTTSTTTVQVTTITTKSSSSGNYTSG